MSHNLLQQLKQWRDEQAQKEGREAYFVFGNKVLEDTVEVNPQTTYDLLQIKGWGEKKVAKYGKQVLQILQGETVTVQTSPLQKKDIDSTNDFNTINTISNPEIPIFSVVGFLDQINDIFSRMGMVKVRGELHDINERGGNVYLHLKDLQQNDTLISCFISRWVVEYYEHLLQEGADVVVFAQPSVYKTGRFSLVVNSIEPVGEGAHLRALELLKKKLHAKGMFDDRRKRAIPPYIKNIGLVTSVSGAALIDFQKHVDHGGYEIVLHDVRVEGDLAEQSIVSAIQTLNTKRPDLDLLILMRGGGSVENLKAFNSERVAEAIAASRIPTLTAIGHEKDVSIADLAADYSCSTPTAAGTFLRRQREILVRQVQTAGSEVTSRTKELFLETGHLINQMSQRTVTPLEQLLSSTDFRISRSTDHMTIALQQVFQAFTLHESRLKNMSSILASKLQASVQRIDIAEAKVQANNPLRVLEKGYSIVYTEGGKIVKSSSEVQSGDNLLVRVQEGDIQVTVN